MATWQRDSGYGYGFGIGFVPPTAARHGGRIWVESERLWLWGHLSLYLVGGRNLQICCTTKSSTPHCCLVDSGLNSLNVLHLRESFFNDPMASKKGDPMRLGPEVVRSFLDTVFTIWVGRPCPHR